MPSTPSTALSTHGSPWRRRAGAVVILALGVALTPACSSGGGAPGAAAPGEAAAAAEQGRGGLSRARIYSSLAELTDDSAVVITGIVQDQRSVADLPGTDLQFTFAEFEVDEVLRGDVPPGSTAVVRQTPSTEAQALRDGARYLLYLTPSGLGGELASHYSVTGVTAGIYEADHSEVVGAGYHRVDADSGDALPAEVVSADALG